MCFDSAGSASYDSDGRLSVARTAERRVRRVRGDHWHPLAPFCFTRFPASRNDANGSNLNASDGGRLLRTGPLSSVDGALPVCMPALLHRGAPDIRHDISSHSTSASSCCVHWRPVSLLLPVSACIDAALASALACQPFVAPYQLLRSSKHLFCIHLSLPLCR